MSRLYTPLRACAALLLVGALPAQAATILVTSNADGAPGAACTLRSAVQAANTNTAVGGCVAGDADGDAINFAATVTTITLTGGEIRITDDVSINGTLATRVTIDAAGNSRIFDIQAPTGTGTQRRVTFSNLVLRNGNSTVNSSAPDAGGAVDLKSGSQATFTNVDVTGSVCGINGGGIHGAGNTDIVITNSGGGGILGTSRIQNNEARGPEATMGGGGVWGAGTVSISGTVIIDNNRATGAAGSGGGVFNLGGTLTIDAGVVISNNTANRAGGGIESAGGTVSVTNASVTGNNAGTAPGNGGGFHGGGAVTATIAGGTFGQNTAVEGGGLWISGAGTLALTGTTVTGNTASGADADQGGGGLYNDGGTLTLSDVDVLSNMATGAAGSGGGILTKGPLAVSNNSDIRSNTSVRAGGGIEVAAAMGVSVTGSLISANVAGSAPGFGGGLHITGAGVVTVNGGRVFGNTAVEGGGLWKAAPGSLTIDGTEISTNMATGAAADQGGGGVYSDGGANLIIANAMITGNTATGTSGSGGGVFNNGGAVSIATTQILENTANRAGGGIEDNAGTGMTLTNVNMLRNNAGTAPGNGGGLHISGAGMVTLTDTQVSENTAVEGGGLWKSGPGTLTVQEGLISDNTASGADADQGGGGIYNDGAGGMLTLDGVVVSGNDATGASGSGGGLLNNTGGSVTISSASFVDNTSNRAGGGIEDNAGGMIAINLSSFDGNATGAAPGNGGALHITGAGTVVMDSSIVVSNQATNQGGGLWNSGLGSLTVRYTEISDNQSGTGGGVYQVAGAKGLIRVANSLVANNRASAAGGGLAADGATVVIENTTVSGNMAATSGGGLASGGGRFLVSNATIALNQAATSGGGLFRIPAGGDSLLSLDNTIVSGNTSPAGANLSGVVMSRGYNLFRTTDGGTVLMEAGTGPDLTGVDPRLLPLADNGGPTRTHAVEAGSPAIGAGMTSLLIDQRGFSQLTPSTIGAFSYGAGPLAGDDAPVAVAEFGLSAPSPNPFRGQTTMRVSMANDEAVEVVLYDALGRRVQTLYSGTPTTGVDVTVDGRALAPGVYVVRMTGATGAATQRITVTR